MCFNIGNRFKKEKHRKDDNEEKEDIGLLGKEIQKWNKKRELETREGRPDDALQPVSASKHKF